MSDPHENLRAELQRAERNRDSVASELASQKAAALAALVAAQATYDTVQAQLRPTEDAARELRLRLTQAERDTLGHWVVSRTKGVSGNRYIASSVRTGSDKHWDSRVWLRVMTQECRKPERQWEATIQTVSGDKRVHFSKCLGPEDMSLDAETDFENRAAVCDGLCAEAGWHLVNDEPGELVEHPSVLAVSVGGIKLLTLNTVTKRVSVRAH